MEKNYEEKLKLKSDNLDEVLCELQKSDSIMKEFTGKREVLGDELWSGAAQLMVDGYKSQLLQAIVLMEDIRTFINADDSVSDLKMNMLAQIEKWMNICRDEYEKNKQVRDAVKRLNKREL